MLLILLSLLIKKPEVIGFKDSKLTKKIKNSLSNNSIDGIKKITLTSPIICSLEKVILLWVNVLMNTELVPETCLVVWLLLPPEDLCLFKMLLKFSDLLISLKLDNLLDKLPELTLLNSSELLIFSIISLNSLFLSIMVSLPKKMF